MSSHSGVFGQQSEVSPSSVALEPHLASCTRGLVAPVRTGGEVPIKVLVTGESMIQLACVGGDNRGYTA